MPTTEIGTLTVHRDGDPGKTHPCAVWAGLLLASTAVVISALYVLGHIVVAALS